MAIEKMKIRSITYTIDLRKIRDVDYLKGVGLSLQKIQLAYAQSNISIRTIRFNIVAIDGSVNEEFIENVRQLSLFAESVDARWFCISFDLSGLDNEVVNDLCGLGEQIITQFDNSFVNFIVASEHINTFAVYKVSEVVKRVSKNSHNGIDNFRLGVSLNVKANTPFFPFSYSDNIDSFSIAIESTSKVLELVKAKFDQDYKELREYVVGELTSELSEIDLIAVNAAEENVLGYNGQDISLSPFPDEHISVVEILNCLGVKDFGSNGTQFLTSYLTSILKEVIAVDSIKPVGFNGVMYSLLEDTLMCAAHDRGNFTMDSIILYSTVCGCGLDMIPLPGDVLTEEIASMILDVGTTSIKLNKPLGFRALPIDGKSSGERTQLKMDFLTNTKIPEVKHIHIDKSIFASNKFVVKS